MKAPSLAAFIGVAVVGWLTLPVRGQNANQQRGGVLTPEELRNQTRTDLSLPLDSIPKIDAATSRDWPLPNLDPANSRYATSTQINASSVKSLAVRWLYHTRASASSPIVVNRSEEHTSEL